MSGTLFFLPFALIRLRGLSSAEAGAAFLSLTLLLAGLAARWPVLLHRRPGTAHRPRLPLVAGPAIAGVGFAWLGFGVSPSIAHVAGALPAMVVLGIQHGGHHPAADHRHAGCRLPPAVPYCPRHQQINNAVARVAGLLAVAILGSAALPLQAHLLAQRLDNQGVTASLRPAVA